MDYKEAGVDISAGESLVSWLKGEQTKSREQNRTPHQDKLVSGIGGFSALFRANFQNYEEPCLVSATDGVGTKLLLAVEYGDYSTIGQDLVAMCVNDLICCGADPLFFLDYYATGKLQLDIAKPFLKSVQEACERSQCALIGGETAEMPGVYQKNDFDCAGFAVGVVDKPKIYGAHLVKESDLVIGVESSGFHSNGYSLVRKLFEKDLQHWKDQLLKPTHLYVELVQHLKNTFQGSGLKAMAHITGGGITNIPRVLPEDLGLEVFSWEFNDLFAEAQSRAQLSETQMLETFNCGYGFALVVSPDLVDAYLESIQSLGFECSTIGRVVSCGSSMTNGRWQFKRG